MTRVQILLPEEQDRRLEELAARRRESKAKVVRRALDLLFRSESVSGRLDGPAVWAFRRSMTEC